MRICICILLSLLLSFQSHASEFSFIAKEQGKTLVQIGECNETFAPESTFKIPLSLMGFDSSILKTDTSPSWPLPVGVDPFINVCKGDHTPRAWMRDSCLWYSRVLTKKLGMEKFQKYVTSFSYGNMDLSGGIEGAWISSSLRISLNQQVEFLQKMIDKKFPVSRSSYDNTKKIMFVQEMPGGWKLYGKTGNGRSLDENGNKTDLLHGWFVGYIEKNNRQVVFAAHIKDSEKQRVFASLRARNEALIQLWQVIESLEGEP